MNTVNLSLPAEKLTYWMVQDSHREVLFQPRGGQMLTFTWKEIDTEARKLLSFFRAQGLKSGDKVAILSKNCAHWIIADIALMYGGLVSIPIYPTANAETISYVLEHSESKMMLVGKLDDWQSQVSGIPDTMPKVAFPYPTMPAENQWDTIMQDNEPADSVSPVAADDLMTILYTSGSTGNPKGAMHTYQSFVNAGKNVGERLAVTPDDRIMSYLPLSHCTERAYVESTLLNYGLKVYFVDSLDTFAADLGYAKPTIFGSVPRLWTQFQKKILTKMPNKKLQTLLKIPLLGGIVKNKIKKQMGLDQTRIFISGSAPLSEKILHWYSKLDINIGEGWGMTESFACGSVLGPDMEVRIGTVSKPLPGTQVIIAEDNEILLKTESDMLGYYKEEEKTKETINEDGYIHTGDLGELKDGYLSIVGRKKDIFKTEKGKYVAPIPIESEFGDNEYIEQMCLMGTQLVQPVLVVNLSEHAAAIEKSELESSLLSTLSTVNSKLEAHAKVSAIIVAKQAWTTDSGELTPTLKVKRHIVEKTFLPVAQNVEKGKVSWY
ncbi:AMP-binding protein [Planctobacterium marinum]|uniref:AMP-binding protein n=1 Tax=Planctobacterium marinum TaxID=1631968 RepID=UPI001E5E2D49|nr:AMP-binding protein [Planctobacterium marinum]MCC2607972.1 AMP-binding protein [Planctobacterium marinum]